MALAALPDDQDAIAERQRCGRAAFDGRGIEQPERVHQSETAGLVEGHWGGLDYLAVEAGQPDGFGLGDQVADRQHQLAFGAADHDTRAEAFGAEKWRGIAVL